MKVEVEEAPTPWWRWQRGRQHSGYDKLLLARGWYPLPFDLYLLSFPTGAFAPRHRDRHTLGQHFRLNVVLWAAHRGGEFICDGALVDRPRIKLFRPDLHEHEVTRVEHGRRLVLSLGWLWPRPTG